MEANVKSPIITFLSCSIFLKNPYIGLPGDEKYFDHKENQNQRFVSIPDSAVKTNLVAPAACCRLQ